MSSSDADEGRRSPGVPVAASCPGCAPAAAEHSFDALRLATLTLRVRLSEARQFALRRSPPATASHRFRERRRPRSVADPSRPRQRVGPFILRRQHTRGLRRGHRGDISGLQCSRDVCQAGRQSPRLRCVFCGVDHVPTAVQST